MPDKTPTPAAPHAYRPDVDGLRALAILSVVFYHAGLRWLTGGFIGVDIFFVISGYLIGGHIYAELRAGAFSYREFYRRRAKRILPAFFAVIVFTLLAGLILLSPAEMTLLGRSAFAATLSASNLLFWGTDNYFAAKSDLNPLLMTWSLGVEEQFYLVIPLLMVFVARIRRSLILPAILAVCILSFGFAWAAQASYPMAAFYLLSARAWELGIGVALAVAELNRKAMQPQARRTLVLSVAGLGLLLTPIFLFNAVAAFPWPAALPSVVGTTMLLAVPGSWINRRLLALPPLVSIGRISYSWYLWHWPLLAFLHILYGDRLPIAAALLAIALSLGAAVLSYSFIEQPFRRSRLAPAPLLARYAVFSATLLGVCAALWLSRGIPQRFPALATMEAADQTIKNDPCLASDADRPNLSAQCFDVSATRPSVALWGDSHAAALAPALRSSANDHGYGFAELEKNSCTPLIGATHYIPRLPLLAAACLRFNRSTFDLLQSDRRISVVVLVASWAAPLNRSWLDGWLSADPAHEPRVPTPEATRQLYVESLARTIRALRAAGKQVIVLRDTPAFGFDPLMRIRTARIPARHMLAHWFGARGADDPGSARPAGDASIPIANSVLEEAVSQFPGVPLIDLAPALCPAPTLCSYRDGDTLLYVDSTHLSPAGATRALAAFPLLEAPTTTPPK
jgi:peptidoglycan/LPS O-acetylase OafA/YrhL